MAVILAIDEDVVLTMSVDLQLGHLGHTVRRVNTANAAVAILNEQPIACIVIDPSVSEHAGWQIVEQWAPRIPTVVISHDPTDTTEQRAAAASVRIALRKPMMVRELIDVIVPLLPSEEPAVTPPPAAAPSTTKYPTEAERRAARKRNSAPPNTSAAPPAVATPAPGDPDPLGLLATSADDELLAGLPTTAHNPSVPEETVETLGMRMRAQRIKRNIPLNQVDLAIGVHMAFLQAMEEDRFSHLPRGRMAEEMITKYAKYLNLDVAAALQHYKSFQYSEPVEPITSFGAANLVVVRYSGIIKAALVMLAFGAAGYGIWQYKQADITRFAAGAALSVRDAIPGLAPTATPTPTQTPTPTATATATLTPTATATATLTATATATAEPATLTPKSRKRSTPTKRKP